VSPGLVADLANADYHAQTDWLSSTQLKGYLPERYKTGGGGYALAFGTAFHTAALGAGEEIVTVETSSDRTKAYTEAAAEAEAAGKVAILAADSDRIAAMVDALHAHPTASALLFSNDGVSEESAFWVDPNGIQHKARFDRRIPGAIVDLKSTSEKPGADNLAKSVLNYGYDLSAAHYLEVANGLGLTVDAFALVFVSKEAPHRVTVAELDDTFLARGRILRALAIERHLNAAPAYEGATGYLTLSAPRWARLDEGISA
jgi:hypothetical protein